MKPDPKTKLPKMPRHRFEQWLPLLTTEKMEESKRELMYGKMPEGPTNLDLVIEHLRRHSVSLGLFVRDSSRADLDDGKELNQVYYAIGLLEKENERLKKK